MTTTYLSDSYLRKAQEDLPEADPFVDDAENLLKARMRAAAANPGATDQGGYSQVDLKPEWYKTFLKGKGYDQNGPPVQSKTAAAVANATGYLGQNANQRAAALQGNDRGSGHSVALSNMGTLLGLGSVLTNAFTKKDSDDFDTQQARAVKDAEALKKNSKTGFSNNELLGYLNYEKNGLRNAQLARRDAEKNAQVITEADPNSKESRDSQRTMVDTGIMAPEVAGNMSKEQIKLGRTGAMQTQAQRNKTDEFDYENSTNQGNKLNEEERADRRRIEAEQRDENQRRLQAAIPGRRWANDTPPDPATQTKAREYLAAQHDMVEGAQEMQQIQAKLQELGVRAAALGQTVDKYIGDDNTKQLLARAQLLQKNMVTAARILDHTGVLQQYEKAMEDAVNPMAGTIGAYFRGSAPWQATADIYSRYGEDQLRTLGSYAEGDEQRPQGGDAVMQQRAEDQVTHYERPQARRPTPGRQQAQPQADGEDYGAQPGDKLPVAPIPADAKKKAAPQPREGADNDVELNGTYVVEFNGQRSQPRKLTKAKYKALMQKYGMSAVKRVD